MLFELVKGTTIFSLCFFPISDRISCTTVININILQAVIEAYYNDGKKKMVYRVCF